MMRYLRLYARFVAFSLSKSMQFRMDFFFRIAMDCVYYAVNISFFEILYLHFPSIGGWDHGQTRIFIACFLMVDAIQMTLFSNNLWPLPMMINRGELDYYLLRPVSSLFFLTLRDIAFNSFINFLITVGILVWALMSYTGVVHPGAVVLMLALVVNGAFLFLAIQLILNTPVFWTHSGAGFAEIGFSLMKVMERPHRIYSRGLRIFFTYFLPYCLMASIPASLVLDGLHFSVLAKALAATAGVWTFTLTFWRLGLRSYSSASS